MCNCGRVYKRPVAVPRGAPASAPLSVTQPSSDQAGGQPVVPTARRFRRGIFRKRKAPVS